MSQVITTDLAISLIDDKLKIKNRLISTSITEPITSYEQGRLVIPPGTIGKELSTTEFKHLVIRSDNPISLKLNSPTSTAIIDVSFFAVNTNGNNSIFLTNTSGSDSNIEFTFYR